MKKKANKSQQMKKEFRASDVWKKFRLFMIEAQEGLDIITLKKLYRGANCHHCDLREENYTKTDDPSRFCMLNKKTHSMVHWLYPYYVKDPEVIDRLIVVLENMKRCSTD